LERARAANGAEALDRRRQLQYMDALIHARAGDANLAAMVQDIVSYFPELKASLDKWPGLRLCTNCSNCLTCRAIPLFRRGALIRALPPVKHPEELSDIYGYVRKTPTQCPGKPLVARAEADL